MIDATPLLRLYGGYRRAALERQEPSAVQERQLRRLLKAASATRFGRDHDFAGIRNVADFQRAVPLRDYDAFWADYWEATFPVFRDLAWPGLIPYLAISSGTSAGRSKFIPVSRAMVRANSRAGVDLLVHHLRHRPQSRVLGGKNFMLGGTVDLVRQADGVVSGDLSAIARLNVPFWSHAYVFPPHDLSREADWERKMAAVGETSLGADIRTLAGTPAWLLLFLEGLAERVGRPKRLAALYPNLELLAHGGVNFAPYQGVFAEWLEGSRAEPREVYPASEGFIALADQGPGEGLRLLLDNGLFFEFVPVEELREAEPRRQWIGDVEIGPEYAIVLSSNAGLWAYLLGDTVRFVSLDPPRIRVTGRISYFLSAFGEHVRGEEIDDAVLRAARAVGGEVLEYAVGPIYPNDERPRGRHVYVVEFRNPAALSRPMEIFAQTIDRRLSEVNYDYEDHRSGGFGMDPPEVIAVRSGAFAAWMRKRGRIGGQNKVPRVIQDGDLLADLLAHASAWSWRPGS